jgi:hypothetical protein
VNRQVAAIPAPIPAVGDSDLNTEFVAKQHVNPILSGPELSQGRRGFDAALLISEDSSSREKNPLQKSL